MLFKKKKRRTLIAINNCSKYIFKSLFNRSNFEAIGKKKKSNEKRKTKDNYLPELRTPFLIMNAPQRCQSAATVKTRRRPASRAASAQDANPLSGKERQTALTRARTSCYIDFLGDSWRKKKKKVITRREKERERDAATICLSLAPMFIDAISRYTDRPDETQQCVHRRAHYTRTLLAL